MKKKYLFIFLSNKLISCDGILPIVLEVKKANPVIKVIFYCFDTPSFHVIRRNEVILDAINHVGELKLFGFEEQRCKFIFFKKTFSRVFKLFELFKLSIISALGLSNSIHFRILNDFPFSLIAWANQSSVFLFDPVVNGYSDNERAIDNLERTRTITRNTVAKNITKASFCENSQIFSHSDEKRFVLGKFWYGSEWVFFSQQREYHYLKRFFSAQSMPVPKSFIVYTLGYLGKVDFVKDGHVFKRKLCQTLRVFSEVCSDQIVLIKPHFNTDLNYVRGVIDKFPNNNFFICDLHPAVLVGRAQYFVANYYSTVMGVAFAARVPIIEFSEYCESALEVTRFKGMRPDIVGYYINNDETEFRELLRGLKIRSPENQGLLAKPDRSGVTKVLAGID